jgi:predicted membrane channel-forming protein YqfA (hemolysin III family)
VAASIDIGDNQTQLLGKLAAQIGTTADKIFPWYVKQQVFEGWLHLLTAVTLLVFFAILIRINFRKADFGGDGNRHAVVLFISSVALFISLSNFVTQIVNPNYHALQAITSDMAKLLK